MTYLHRVKACVPVQRRANSVWSRTLDACLEGAKDARSAKRCLRSAYRAYRVAIGATCRPLLAEEKR